MNSGPIQRKPVRSSEEIVDYILHAFDDGLSMTLRDLYRKNPKYSWTEFMEAVSSLVAEGYIEGKGDGFVVHYFLTNKGRAAAGSEG